MLTLPLLRGYTLACLETLRDRIVDYDRDNRLRPETTISLNHSIFLEAKVRTRAALHDACLCELATDRRLFDVTQLQPCGQKN